ncbi:integrase, catalytic region, zinc finger, CCHC-type containing protein [Tanacetum coccineum]
MRVALANLIANLKLNVDENKKIQKQLKKANASLTQGLTECKSILGETSRTLGESNSIRDSFLVALQNKETEFESNLKDHFRARLILVMEILIKTCLMPLVLKTQNDSFVFFHELKQEMHAGLKYVESLEKEVHKLESDKAEFSNMYDMLFQECVSNDVMCSYLHSLSDLDAHTELQYLYLHKVKECECMYQIDTKTTQTRAPQLPQTSKNTNPRVSTSTGVTHRTNVSRPQPRSNQMKDKAVPNTSHVKFKKTEVEDHHRISITCGKCVFNSNHDACVSKYLNDVNARTKKPKVVHISTRKPKSQAHKYVATHRKKTVASKSTVKDSKSYYRMLYEKTSKAWKWWIEQQCPSGYKWVPKTKMKWVPKVRNENVQKRVSFAIDNASRITNVLKLTNTHMTGNLSLLCNFVKKYLGTVHFGNDQFAPILGYGDLVQGNITINRVYYVGGLNHNLFSVGQFCDADLEVSFRKSTCFIRDLQGSDLLTSNRGSDLYTIYLHETTSSTPICLMAKASPTKAWLWHRRLSHLNFDYINLLSKKDVVIGLPKLKYVKDQLCSSCEVSKAKRSSFKTKVVPSSKGRLNLLHMDLCCPIDGENLDKMKEKRDLCILVGYSTQFKGYHVYNKRTRLIVESIHLRFDEIKEMSETSVANDTSGLVLQRQKASDDHNSDPIPQLQNVSPSADTTAPT